MSRPLYINEVYQGDISRYYKGENRTSWIFELKSAIKIEVPFAVMERFTPYETREFSGLQIVTKKEEIAE